MYDFPYHNFGWFLFLRNSFLSQIPNFAQKDENEQIQQKKFVFNPFLHFLFISAVSYFLRIYPFHLIYALFSSIFIYIFTYIFTYFSSIIFTYIFHIFVIYNFYLYFTYISLRSHLFFIYHFVQLSLYKMYVGVMYFHI